MWEDWGSKGNTLDGSRGESPEHQTQRNRCGGQVFHLYLTVPVFSSITMSILILGLEVETVIK